MADPQKRPWFGPKRIGYGLRPQTWQAWVVTLVPMLIVVVVALALVATLRN